MKQLTIEDLIIEYLICKTKNYHISKVSIKEFLNFLVFLKQRIDKIPYILEEVEIVLTKKDGLLSKYINIENNKKECFLKTKYDFSNIIENIEIYYINDINDKNNLFIAASTLRNIISGYLERIEKNISKKELLSLEKKLYIDLQRIVMDGKKKLHLENNQNKKLVKRIV